MQIYQEKPTTIRNYNKQFGLLSYYLVNCILTVISNRTLSSPTDVILGVSQGPILGPLLFLSSVNDLQELIPEIHN